MMPVLVKMTKRLNRRCGRRPPRRNGSLQALATGLGHRGPAAFDDGVQTRLTFAPKRELPALFVRNDDGSESLLNFNIEGDEVVVHWVARRFVLRRGKLTGCIVNKGFAGSGERLKSGTIAPGVDRELKDETP